MMRDRVTTEVVLKGDLQAALRGLLAANGERSSDDYARGFADAINAVATSYGLTLGVCWQVADAAPAQRR